MTWTPSDAAHDRAHTGIRPRTYDDRTGPYARFTPLDPDNVPAGDPVDITARVRVTSRATGSPDPTRAVQVVVTVDDRTAGAALASHPRWEVETWTRQDPTAWREGFWVYGIDYAVAVDAFLITPTHVELEGYSQVVDMSYGYQGEGAQPPPWINAAQ